jgi:hypothetical protein
MSNTNDQQQPHQDRGTDWGPDSVVGNSAFNPHQQGPGYQGPPAGQPPYPAQQPGGPGKPPKKHTVRNILLGITAGFVLLVGGCTAIVASVGGSDDSAKQSAGANSSASPVDNGPTPDPVVTPTSKPTTAKSTAAPEPTAAATEGTGCDLNASPEEYAECLDRWVKGETVSPTKAAPQLTASQEQAVGSAQSYLELSAFSRKGLIKQLSSSYGEGFSVKDATFAVDYLKVDWNEQAAKKAKEYLALQHFSRAGLIKQLESRYGEQFTHAQAVYGVNKAGL